MILVYYTYNIYTCIYVYIIYNYIIYIHVYPKLVIRNYMYMNCILTDKYK